MNGSSFGNGLKKCLIFTIKLENIVVLENLPDHNVVGIRQCVAEAGMHLLNVAPHSRDLNPIEQVFGKLKATLRRMTPRCFGAMCDAIKITLEMFKEIGYLNYIRHSG